ncbi:MAG: hypothetical protein HOO91_17770 [Bacteroidales bacterium]|nr:hypothetical protein [Bacteroidales bacterium]
MNYQTPPSICEYMISLMPEWAFTILEPTPGEGNIVRQLLLKDVSVTAPDDFFTMNFKQRFDCIVMNPPFSHKTANLQNSPKDIDLKGLQVGYYILKQCMAMSDHVIAIMPITIITDSDKRKEELALFGLKSVTILPRKTFDYNRIASVVLELHKGYVGLRELKMSNFK